jgi:hypothetical protein
VDDDLTGVARDSETVLDVLDRYTGRGFVGSFAAASSDAVDESGRLRCDSCRVEFAAKEAVVTELRRLEGASDPDDMLAVVALRCPRCSTLGSLIVNYGPTATTDDAAALLALPDPIGNAH